MGKRQFQNEPRMSAREIALGALGAFAAAAVMAAAYFGISLLNISVEFLVPVIACVSGFALYLLADLGFRLLSGEKRRLTAQRLICVGAVSFFMILAAVHSCEFYELYQAFMKQGMGFAEAWKAYPQWTAIKDISDELAKEVWAALVGAAVPAYCQFAHLRKELKKHRR